MDIEVARKSLALYAGFLGEWIHTAPTDVILNRIEEYATESIEAQAVNDMERHLESQLRYVRLLKVHEARRVVDAEPVLPDNVINLFDRKPKEELTLEVSFEGEEYEAELVTLIPVKDLAFNLRRPLYRHGQHVYLQAEMDVDGVGNVEEGFMPVIVVAIIWEHDQIRYRVGHPLPDDTIAPEDDWVEECDLYVEVPERPRQVPQSNVRPRLSLVTNP